MRRPGAPPEASRRGRPAASVPPSLPRTTGRIRAPSPVLRYAGTVVLVGGAYYASARLGLLLSLVERNVTPLWPPTGIAVVAMLVLGRSVWPGVAVAALLVNAPISADLGAAAVTAVGNTLAPLVAATLLRRVGFRQEIDRQRDALAIVFLGALVSMAVSASVGTATLAASGSIPWSGFWPAWTVWWTGDAMGVLVVAPFLLTVVGLVGRRTAIRRVVSSWPEAIEAVLLLLLVAGVAGWVTGHDLRLLFLVLPILGWIAWRFQQPGAAPAALLVATIATWAAAPGPGPFAHGTLFHRMLTLQAFNTTVALSSFFFAALVTERARAKEQLERAAVDLEERVAVRTSELSAANRLLRREVAEREEAERRLGQRERQLAEAQHVARIGSWEWMIDDDRVSWSDEMYRIHGFEPQEFPVTFERAVSQVVPEDVRRIRQNVEAALREGVERSLPPSEYRIVLPDSAERVLLGKARIHVDASGRPVRMVGTVQDVTEDKRAEREHHIAETLQRSLLPDRLAEIPGLEIAARYVPATGGMEIGGDWYDVVSLPRGAVGLAIGDVAGHGLRAASTMGQLRMALRAYALEEESPAAVVARAHLLTARLLTTEMATLVYLVFDPDTGDVRFANAGHPPPLVVGADGSTAYLEGALGPPLGVDAEADPEEARDRLEPGSTLVLFTDGLVERRGDSIRDGLDRLRREAAAARGDLEELCDHLLGSLIGDQADDDVALLVLRPVRIAVTPFHLRFPAEPRVLAPLRQAVRRWLREAGADPQQEHDILVACGEAWTNAVQHAYGAGEGVVDSELRLLERTVEVIVRDEGRWRPPSGDEGGRGLTLMRAFMDSVDVSTGPEGTRIRMRRLLEDDGR